MYWKIKSKHDLNIYFIYLFKNIHTNYDWMTGLQKKDLNFRCWNKLWMVNGLVVVFEFVSIRNFFFKFCRRSFEGNFGGFVIVRRFVIVGHLVSVSFIDIHRNRFSAVRKCRCFFVDNFDRRCRFFVVDVGRFVFFGFVVSEFGQTLLETCVNFFQLK